MENCVKIVQDCLSIKTMTDNVDTTTLERECYKVQQKLKNFEKKYIEKY